MATTLKKKQPVGSTGWIQNEREEVRGIVDNDVEEFHYSVRNELEWLNEHMADIFSKDQKYAHTLRVWITAQVY